MIDMSRPCSCGGNNENCYKCAGLGVIYGPVEEAQKNIFVLPKALNFPSKRSKGPEYRTCCPDCGHRFLSNWQSMDHYGRCPGKPVAAPSLRVQSVQQGQKSIVEHNRIQAPPKASSATVSLASATILGRSKLNKEFQDKEHDSQSTDDGNTRDGSKHIGHFARESGRYGSMPAHDDYGDESNSD